MEELTNCRLKTAKRRRKVVVAGREERIGMEGLSPCREVWRGLRIDLRREMSVVESELMSQCLNDLTNAATGTHLA